MSVPDPTLGVRGLPELMSREDYTGGPLTGPLLHETRDPEGG